MPVGRARAQPGPSLARQPCLRAPLLPGPSLVLFKPRPRQRLLPGGPRCPLPFLFLLVPTPLSPHSVHGKNAVSSEQGPRVTGGGSPSCMAPGVREPLLRPRLPCPRPCLRLCPPASPLQLPQDCNWAAAAKQTATRLPLSAPGTSLPSFSWLWPPLSLIRGGIRQPDTPHASFCS